MNTTEIKEKEPISKRSVFVRNYLNKDDSYDIAGCNQFMITTGAYNGQVTVTTKTMWEIINNPELSIHGDDKVKYAQELQRVIQEWSKASKELGDVFHVAIDKAGNASKEKYGLELAAVKSVNDAKDAQIRQIEAHLEEVKEEGRITLEAVWAVNRKCRELESSITDGPRAEWEQAKFENNRALCQGYGETHFHSVFCKRTL